MGDVLTEILIFLTVMLGVFLAVIGQVILMTGVMAVAAAPFVLVWLIVKLIRAWRNGQHKDSRSGEEPDESEN